MPGPKKSETSFSAIQQFRPLILSKSSGSVRSLTKALGM